DRIGKFRDLLQALRHALDRFFGERETVDESRVLAGGLRRLHVLGVRDKKLLCIAAHRLCSAERRAVLGARGRRRPLARRAEGRRSRDGSTFSNTLTLTTA